MRIVLFCDQKWRDLPSLCVIGLLLKAAGHKVTIASTKEVEPLLYALKPHVAVFNHILDKRYVRLANRLKDVGTKIVVLPTEGATPTHIWGPLVFGQFTDYSMVDLYLSWNKITADGLVANGKIPASAARVIGCPRFDFAKAPLRDTCMTREEFCARNGLDPARPLVTFASRFALAKLTYADANALEKVRADMYEVGFAQCVELLGYQLDEVFDYYRRGLDAFVDSYVAVARAFPNCQIVFKPHPNDDIHYIDKAISAHSLPNVRLVSDAYIGDVLRATDVLVNSDCNTSFEAWVQGVPVVDVQIVPDPITGRTDIQACNPVAATTDETVALVKSALEKAPLDPEKAQARSKLIKVWYDDVDGARCRAAAQEIHALAKAAKAQRPRRLPLRRGEFRKSITAIVRYKLGVPGGVPLRDFVLGNYSTVNRASGVFDKVVTSADVARMEAHLKAHTRDFGALK